MTSRDNRVQVYLSDEEKRQIKEWADATGKSASTLCREAVLEYTDHDRAARLADRMDDIEAELAALKDAVTDATGEKKKHTNDGEEKSTTVRRTHEIAKALYDNYGDTTHEERLDLHIENIAGGSDQTIDKYHKQLKKRQLAFEHPSDHSQVWYLDREVFADALVSYAKQTPAPEQTAKSILEPYGGLRLTDLPIDQIDGKLHGEVDHI